MTQPSHQPSSVGPYRLLGKIGVGGMGVVYRVQHVETQQVAAMKIFRPARFTRQLLQRFHAESEAMSRLNHPGICRIYEVGTANTTGGPAPYLVMEWVEGRRLGAHATEHRLTVKQRVDLIAQLCDAVEHAHVKGIIHRDLKPANILVDPSGRPKVLDFGIARAIDADLAYTTSDDEHAGSTLAGTLAYMSPEQAAREVDRLDARSDVYAIGVIAFELLCGRLPYELRGRKMREILHIIRTQEPAPLGQFEPSCRGDLEHVIAKTLEKERHERYESAAALADDLRRWVMGEPTRARRPRLWSAFDRVARQTRDAVDAVGHRVRTAIHRDDPSQPDEPPATAPSDSPAHGGPVRAFTAEDRLREGVKQLRDGDHTMALLWFVAALQKCGADQSKLESMLRTRVALVLQQGPRLLDVNPDAPVPGAWVPGNERSLEIANDLRGNAFLVRMIEPDTGRNLLGPLWHHTSVQQADFGDEGRAVVTTCRDETVRVWSCAPAHPTAHFGRHAHEISCVAFSPTGGAVVTADAGGHAFLLHRHKPQAPIELAHDDAVHHATFTHDGRLLATAGDDRTVRVWDVSSGTALASPIVNERPVVETHFVREGKQVVAVMDDGSVRVWEVSTGKPMTPTLGPDTALYKQLLRDARARAPVELVPQRPRVEVPPILARLITSISSGPSGAITHAMFSPDARFALTISARGEAVLWDAGAALPLSAPFDSLHRVTAGAISPDASVVVVGSSDGAVRFWSIAPDARTTGELIAIAEVLSCHLVDDALGLYPLGSADWRAAWGRSSSHFRK